jgi:hypothetical protein
VRGWAHAVELEPWLGGRAPARGPDRLKALCQAADARAAGLAFDADAPPEKRGTCAPFHPAATVRAHLEAGAPDAVVVRARLAGRRVTLRVAPHPSCLDDDERPLVAYLSRPRTLEEISAAALCPPRRAQRLLRFLYDAQALDLGETLAPATPLQLLELADGASPDEVRRAYRRLARELHPDRHPDATPAEREALERRFTALHEAYRLLTRT